MKNWFLPVFSVAGLIALVLVHFDVTSRASAQQTQIPFVTSGTLIIGTASTTLTVSAPLPGHFYVASSNGTINTSLRPIKLSIVCDDDGCAARGLTGSMEDATAMLEKIANRSVRVEVMVDQNCHPQHQTIEPKPDLVADAR